ncbi:hypothetical protein L204_101260 [Cryptococcus depauperatus]
MASKHRQQDTTRRRVFTTPSPTYDLNLCIKRSAYHTKSNNGYSRRLYLKDSLLALKNEAEALAYLKDNTSIPVPNVVASFEDRGCFYLILEQTEGLVRADELPAEAHGAVLVQLELYVEELHTHRSSKCESFVGKPFFSERLGLNLRTLTQAAFVKDMDEGYVLCHANLGWENILVDPESYEIRCITGWELAGYYPVEVEGAYWRRRGPCLPLDGEDDDQNQVIDLLYTKAVEKWKPHIRSARRAAEFEPNFLASTSSLFSMPPTQRIETVPLQRRLWKYDINHPINIPVSSSSLSTHVGLAARLALVEDYEALAKDLEEDGEAFSDMVHGIGGLVQPATDRWIDVYDHLHASLPRLYRTLSTSLLASHDVLSPLCNYLAEDSRLATRIRLLSIQDEEIGGEQLAKDLKKLQTRKDHSMFATNLLVLSHAAETALALLPDRPVRFTASPAESAAFEQTQKRMLDLVAGGTGGWSVQIVDVLKSSPVPRAPLAPVAEDKENGRVHRSRTSFFHRFSVLRGVEKGEKQRRRCRGCDAAAYHAYRPRKLQKSPTRVAPGGNPSLQGRWDFYAPENIPGPATQYIQSRRERVTREALDSATVAYETKQGDERTNRETLFLPSLRTGRLWDDLASTRDDVSSLQTRCSRRVRWHLSRREVCQGLMTIRHAHSAAGQGKPRVRDAC